MAWYKEEGELQDVVLSTRVRFARNLEEYPFATKLSGSAAAEISQTVKTLFPDYTAVSFSAISEVEARSYVERHYVSPEFTDRRIPRTLLIGESENVQIMIGEEDHLRIQSIVSGFDVKKAFEFACKADDTICNSLKIAFSEKYGFLTHCPTNLGNAMRVSAMLFLPALTKSKQIGALSNQLVKLGVTIRGMYGEGSGADGYVYQISNRSSLGVTETELLKNISDIISKVAKTELDVRDSIFKKTPDIIRDKIYRSVAILKNAHMLQSGEFNERISDIRLGVYLGLVKNITQNKLTELIIAAQSATLMLSGENLDIGIERDKARAKLVKNTLREIECV